MKKKRDNCSIKSDLIVSKNPKSMFSESIKTIRTNLAFSTIDKDMKVILNTSPESGDGKSFVSANLAAAYAQENKRVLIIDCDLRKGRQHEIFEVMNLTSGGYSNLILNYKEESSNLSQYIIQTNNKNISLLPTGPTPPNPVELLSSDNNKKLIKDLRDQYDIIILDCPPVIGLSDTLIMTKYSDVNMVVVSNKKTKIANLQRTKKIFDQANAPIAGVIINKASLKDNNYYSYYCSDYYYTDGGKSNSRRRKRRARKF